jgi:hypothetical protein
MSLINLFRYNFKNYKFSPFLISNIINSTFLFAYKMACSKIFSGDLPEITSEIIQYFRNDFSTLHSCILVNRLWCRLAIPLLWEDPFSLEYPKNYRYIEVYLHNLNDNDKTQLDKYGISNDLFSSNILFNYPSFTHHLNTRKISDSIEKWVATIGIFNYSTQTNYKKLLYRLLFRIFIEKEVNVHTFKVTMLSSEDYEYFNDTTELVIQNPNFIYNIRSLTLDFNLQQNENILSKFMIFLYSNCNSILSLYFTFPPFCSRTNTEKYLSQLIDSQQNLKKIELSYNEDFPLYHSLLSFKNSNCTNTLRTIIFYCIYFKNVVVFNEVFEQLNVLESIHIIRCSIDSNFIQQIINLTKPFKLKSLFVNKPLTKPQLLLQKSGEYLENFGFEIGVTQEELELYIKYCSSKIKFLKFSALNDQNIYKTFHLIEKVEQSLNYLTIESYVDKHGSIVLQYLGQVLPSILEYLSLALKINTSDFEIFLKNSQNTFIKKLLIKNIRHGKREELVEKKNILPYIKEYIMKKKRTKYLAFLDYFYTQSIIKDDDLASLKNEVENFRLHNIIIQYYYDLNIEIREFINLMY